MIPLADTEDNIRGYNSVHLDPNEAGSSKLIDRFESYILQYMNSGNIKYPEDYPGVFSSKDDTIMIHSHDDSAYTLTMMRTYPAILNAKYGSRMDVKEVYANNSIVNTSHWHYHPESLEIPTYFNWTNNNKCFGKPVTILTAIYNGYGKMAPLRRNPASCRAKRIKIDSKPITVKILVGPDPEGDLEENFASCTLEPTYTKYNPITIRFFHYDGKTAIRKLQWHDDDLQTDVIT